jgi:hypothetical protein
VDAPLSSIAMMVDGARMRSRTEPCGTKVTIAQLNELVAIITDDHGSVLNRSEFNDAVLMLCENIAGLEMLGPSQRNQLLKNLWSRYQRSIADVQRS